MKVIDFSPFEWYLLSWDDKFILNVNCSYSSFGTIVALELTPAESVSFIESGKPFIVQLASIINRESSVKETKIFERRISKELKDIVTETILKFNKENGI